MIAILGISAYHPDSAACLLVDGQLVAAAEEERFRRVKHWAGFPTESIRYCLREAGITMQQVSHVAVNRRPWAHPWRRAWNLLRWQRDGISHRLRHGQHTIGLRQHLEQQFDCILTANIHHIHHHRAHLASAFLCSPFPSARVVSIDGMGDGVSTMWGRGDGGRVVLHDAVYAPHSLGIFYTALTQFLGFPRYGDEYKVMALAALGKPSYANAIRQLIVLKPYGHFALNLRYFQHHTGGVRMEWQDRQPRLDLLYTPALMELFGGAIVPGYLGQREYDLAASLQAVYLETVSHVLSGLVAEPLCLAGGCALNSVANGWIRQRVKDLYVPPAPHDAGGAIGAALSVWCERLGYPRQFVLEESGYGPQYSPGDIGATIAKWESLLLERQIRLEVMPGHHELCERVAWLLTKQDLVGWFQGRMEFGPRALGHRSILADPRDQKAKDRLNRQVKDREPWRPFAPMVLEEDVSDWFEVPASTASPFMSLTVQVRADKRAQIPAVQHVDGSSRIQTVSRRTQPLLWTLLRTFAARTRVPVLLNTSLNESEPIVCTPEDAIRTFLQTELDVLAIGPYLMRKHAHPSTQ